MAHARLVKVPETRTLDGRPRVQAATTQRVVVGVALCRMFNTAISSSDVPKYLTAGRSARRDNHAAQPQDAA